MAKEKACKICNKVHNEDSCPDCGSKEYTDSFKGIIIVTNPEKSEIAKNINLHKKGKFAIKTR